MKTILQFGFKNGVPEGVPVIDCRAIPNPYHASDDPKEVARIVRASKYFNALTMKACWALAHRDTIAIGCTHGVHRSGEVAKEVAKATGAKIEKYKNTY